MDITPDEATVFHTKLVIALELIREVELGLKYKHSPGRQTERADETTAYGKHLDKAMMQIAKVADRVGAERP